jgi:hypothetical protein
MSVLNAFRPASTMTSSAPSTERTAQTTCAAWPNTGSAAPA